MKKNLTLLSSFLKMIIMDGCQRRCVKLRKAGYRGRLLDKLKFMNSVEKKHQSEEKFVLRPPASIFFQTGQGQLTTSQMMGIKSPFAWNVLQCPQVFLFLQTWCHHQFCRQNPQFAFLVGSVSQMRL